MNKYRVGTYVLVLIIFINTFLVINVKACKDIIACGDATEGDYNLLLKVRDPSRPGLQVLCIVPEGYEYTYRYPWTGKPLNNKVLHKYIGVTTEGDTIPNIVKAGMALSKAGIAYSDADTDSKWVNPTKNAWDDFDWIRYACEKANDEDQAVDLLTIDAVKKMHATGVSENLFVVGPNKGFVVEADAFHFKVKEIDNGVVVMSNYPKELWKTQRKNKLPISRSFDTVVEKYVRNYGAIRLKSLYGIRVVKIGEDFISVKPVSLYYAIKTRSFGGITKINLGEQKFVGYLSVELLDIDKNKAKVRVSNKYKAWEEKMLEHIEPKYGSITIEDMINWSRLHKEDLSGMRPMCQDSYKYEAVAIYKIPRQNYEIMSSGWFSANHACSSIYVPFHICNTDIYDPYETGEAAELSLNLFETYGHKALETSFRNAEEVFLNEINEAEQISIEQIEDPQKISDYLTIVDTSMQRQALITEQIWMEISKIPNQDNMQAVKIIVNKIWNKNYSSSLEFMKNSIHYLKKIPNTNSILNKIGEIALDICKSNIDAANSIGKHTSTAIDEYKEGYRLIKQGELESGFDSLQKAFTLSNIIINSQEIQSIKEVKTEENKDFDIFFLYLVIALIIAILILFTRFRLNFE